MLKSGTRLMVRLVPVGLSALSAIGWLTVCTCKPCTCDCPSQRPVAQALAPIQSNAALPAARPSQEATSALAAQPLPRPSPAVTRKGHYLGFPEQFNRYYTDPAWRPQVTWYVSPEGTGDGRSRSSPTSVANALEQVRPGALVFFTAGTYSACYELDSDRSGTYDEPVVLYGERRADGSRAVELQCCRTRRGACFNLEAADYVALDGFELVGGKFGVRAVGAGTAANQHQRGVALLDSAGRAQSHDGFFTGASDWLVIEGCVAHDTGSGDGHGIYLSNGGDWNLVRQNEIYGTAGSDFQINPDPEETCREEGIAYADPECDALAGTGPTSGRGASDYILVENNFFHHSRRQGPNFTSVRHSIVRNNVFAWPARHGTSFWQETPHPGLGSHSNLIVHNLFISSASHRQIVGLTDHAVNNQFKNNLVVAVSGEGDSARANPEGHLLLTDRSTVGSNDFQGNAWIGGYFASEDGSAPYRPNPAEYRSTTFEPSWFPGLSGGRTPDVAAFVPGCRAPWLGIGKLLPEAGTDRAGRPRKPPVDAGPYAASCDRR